MIDLTKLRLEKAKIRILEADNEFIVVCGSINQNPWKLRRFLPERKTAEIMGLWFGDGDKVNSIGLTNTEIKLIEDFLEFTDTLGIHRNKFLVEIKTREDIDKEILSTILQIPVENFKVFVTNLAREPCIRVRLLTRVLSRLFKLLVELISESSIELKTLFLKGIIAAEGCIGLREDGKIHTVFISLNDQTEKVWLKENFIHPLGIQTVKDNEDSIMICNKNNFDLLLQLNLMNMHPIKNNKFLESFNKLVPPT